MVRLEEDLDLILFVSLDRASAGDHHKWDFFLLVFNTFAQANNVEVDRERRDILDGESLFYGLTRDDVSKCNQAIGWIDVDLWLDTCSFQVDRHHGVIREHDYSFLVDLLVQRLELDHDWLCLARLYCAHRIEN